MMTDQQYDELLKRILDGAAYIEKLDKADPKYIPAMEKYDRLYEEARNHLRIEIAKELPYMHEIYKELGLLPK